MHRPRNRRARYESAGCTRAALAGRRTPGRPRHLREAVDAHDSHVFPPVAPAVRHVEIGPSVTLVPHGWQLVIRKDAGHGRVGAFMLRHGSQRRPPSTMNSEPVEKLASSEATNSTRRVISSGSATHGIAIDSFRRGPGT